MDERGQIEEANQAVADLIGQGVADLIGHPLSAFLGQQDADALHLHRRDVFSSRDRQGVELHLIGTSGKPILVALDSVRIAAADGDQERCRTVLTDLTDRRRVNAAAERARGLAALGTLTGGVAHDFNNLLTVVIGCLRLAKNENLEESQRRTLAVHALEAAERGSRLIRRLQAYGRSDVHASEPLAIDAAIAGSTGLLAVVLGELSEVEIRLGAAEAFVRADPVQLDQILLNLAVNARHAMPDGGTLEIITDLVAVDDEAAKASSLWTAGDYVRVRVRDSGCGMDEATRARIFEPFFTTRDPDEGNGLGLASLSAVIGQLGGSASVESEPGRGTMFELLLPLCDPPARSAEAPADPSLLRLDGTALLVDDHPLVRLVVRHYLEDAGMEVLAAAGADEAMRMADEHNGTIDLLLSDVMMPGTTGPSLARRLRQERPTLKVLLMSAEALEDLVHDGSVPERTPLIEKPFTQEALSITVARLLRGPRACENARPAE